MALILNSTIAEKNVSIATEYFRVLYGALSQNRTHSGGTAGFIPFKFSFTLDGISGLNIYQTLRINTSFLPPGYVDTLDFIVTGVNHKLKDNDWETDVNCVMIPKFEEFDQIITTDNFTYVQYTPPVIVSPTTQVTTNSSNTADNNSTWADRVIKATTNSLVGTNPVSNWCAQYVGDLAQHIINQIIEDGLAPGKSKIREGGGWGDAWNVSFTRNALATGFYELKQSWTLADGNAPTPQETADIINTTITQNAEYGDLIQYYVSDGNPGGNISGVNRGGPVYHCQIWTGKWYQGKEDTNANSLLRIGKGWSSSWPSNYGASFVYGGRIRDGKFNTGDKFEIYWLRIKDEYRK